jgi:hypothetical protein
MIGWVLLSREAVARAEKALTADEQGVVDEVGFLALHQGFADRFFPGTSVLHTRLRYSLFVPWLMLRVASDGGTDLVRRLADYETRLARQLNLGVNGASLGEGVIGGTIWPRTAAQLASMSYWSALGAWQILRPRRDGSLPSRTETLQRLSRMRRPSRGWASDDDGAPLEDGTESPFVLLPPAPDVLGDTSQPVSFALTATERAFLRRHLLGVRRPGTSASSLLARLVEAGVGQNSAEPWLGEIADRADGEDRAALVLARQAAALSAVGRAVYAALAEAARVKDGLASSGRHRDEVKDVVVRFGQDAMALDMDELVRLLPKLGPDLVQVLTETRGWLMDGHTDPAPLFAVYENAERRRKGLRARLSGKLAGRERRAEWNPDKHPAATPLHYRWSQVRRLLTDLAAA